MMTTTMTDRTVAELVEAARRRDTGAFDELVRRYERCVWSVVRGYRLGDADSHDAVQITWLRLVENLDRLRDPERLGSWLATTAGRECLRLIRRRDREVGDVEDRLAQRPDDRFPSPEQHAINDLMATVLWEKVASLPARGQAMLWALTRPDPPAYAELSRRTGMPVGSIGPTRGRYLRRLRDLMESDGLGAEVWR
jgi:RNA polymerase sigma factor (sigma-70 family)